MLGDEVDGIRPAMLQKDDGGFACCQDRFHQVILIAQQIETIAIALMIDGPGFARSLLVSAKSHNDDIGLLSHFHCFLNALSVEGRIA